jgi:hypothetical protein
MTDEFSFDDVDGEGGPRATTPLPGAPSSSRSINPVPGTLFGSSPRPVASGVTRGEKKEETRVRLLHVSDPANVCGGVIGLPENKKFCAAHPSVCDYPATHRGKRVDLMTDTLYIMSPKKGAMHATLFPTLGFNYIPSDVKLADLLNDERPVAMWHVFFDGCNASEEATGANELHFSKDEAWEYLHHPSLDELEKANDFKTPRKVRVKLDLKNEVVRQDILLASITSLDLTRLVSIKHDVITPSQAGVREMFRNWETIKNNFQVIGDALTFQDDQRNTERMESFGAMQDFGVYLNDIGAKTRLLSAKIGQNPRGAAEGESTLWEAMSEMHTELKHLEHATKEFPKGMKTVMEVLEKEKASGERLNANMTKMYKHYKGHLTSSNLRMVSLEQGASELMHAPKAQTQEGDFDFGDEKGAGADVRREIQELRNEVAEMGNKPGLRPAPSPEPSNDNPMFPTNNLAEMMARLTAVETQATGDTCVLGGTSFPSEPSVTTYITTHAIPSCALYWDLFSIMVCMGRQGLTGKERSDKIYSAERGRTGSALEGELVASMTHKRPLCLFGEGSELARLDQGFAMCKTYDHWIGGGTHVSYRAELSTQIRIYTEGILGQIGVAHTPAHHLAHVLLNQVGMQWNAIVGFIDSFYLDLVAKCKFDSTKAWKLVARCVAAIFEATQVYRSKVILLEDSTNLTQKAAFMWATFQTHRVIQTFIAVQFQSHPLIVTEISLFMVRERVDPKELEELSSKCKKAEDSAAKSAGEVKKLLESHTDLKRKHDALHAEFKIAKAKIK